MARTTIASDDERCSLAHDGHQRLLGHVRDDEQQQPNGGVSSPIMTLTTTTTPKCTVSMPSALAVGIRMGTMTRRIVDALEQAPEHQQDGVDQQQVTDRRQMKCR